MNWHHTGFIVFYARCKLEFTGMDIMDKTVKLRPFPGDAKDNSPQSNLTEDQDKSLEFAKKNAQLEEEKKNSLGQLKIIEQLRETLKQEQVRMAGMVKNAAGPDANQLAVKDAQLEEEKSRSLENLKMIVQLRESLKQEQAKTVEMVKMMAEQEARIKASAMSETNELAKKNAQLEEEKKKSLRQIKIIEQLRESLQQEQVKTAEMVKMMAEQEARTKASAALEAKAKELTEALGKIAAIAAAVKTG